MTSEFDFTNDQWAQIASTPYLVGLAVAKADDSGFLGSLRETRTLLHSIAAEPDADGPASLISQAATTDVSEHYERFKASLPEALAVEAVDTCRQITAGLAAVADPVEAMEYRRWVLDVAWTVARAAKEHGRLVSEAESALLQRIADALELPAPA